MVQTVVLMMRFKAFSTPKAIVHVPFLQEAEYKQFNPMNPVNPVKKINYKNLM